MLRRLSAALDRTAAARLLVLGDMLHARSGRAPHTLEQVTAWRAARPALHVTLIRGNHDARAGDPPGEWGVECLDAPVVEEPFVWLHEPRRSDEIRVTSDELRETRYEIRDTSDETRVTSDELRMTNEVSDDASSLVARNSSLVTSPATRHSPPATRPYPVAGHVHPAVALGGNGRAMTLPCFYFGRDYALLPAFGEFTGWAVIRPRVGERVFVLAGDEIITKEP
jgi:metallophosphoesterase superfamily enzyme